MTKFEQLTPLDKVDVFKRATEWYAGHEKHVTRLLSENSITVAPSGSDLFHPELWKPGHWRWFEMNKKREVQNEV